MHAKWSWPKVIMIVYVKVSRDLDYLNFFLKKIIVGHHEGEIPPPLAQMVLT